MTSPAGGGRVAAHQRAFLDLSGKNSSRFEMWRSVGGRALEISGCAVARRAFEAFAVHCRGRKSARDAFCMSALSATRHDREPRAFAERLGTEEQLLEQAIIAFARKPLAVLNAMIREKRTVSPRPPPD